MNITFGRKTLGANFRIIPDATGRKTLVITAWTPTPNRSLRYTYIDISFASLIPAITVS